MRQQQAINPADADTFHFSTVTSVQDTKPKPRSLPWPDFLGEFASPHVRPRKNGPCWIPATFKRAKRRNENVAAIHAVVLDLDGKHETYTADELIARLSRFKYLAHTTHSHTPEAPRWRVILPTAQPFPPDLLPEAIIQAATILDLDADPACHDPARLFFLPSMPAETASHFERLAGDGELWEPPSFEPSPHKDFLDKNSDEHSKKYARAEVAAPPSLPPISYYVHDDTSYCVHDTPIDTEKPITTGDISAWMARTDVGEKCARALNLPTAGLLEKGKTRTFRSPLPGHEDNNPSCSLFVAKDRRVMLRDWSGHFQDGDAPRVLYSMPDLYATIKAGELIPLNTPERLCWTLRLLHEAGLIRLADVPIPDCPDDVTDSTRKVYEGFKLLLGLKWRYEGGHGKPTMFAKNFIARWCGVSPATAGRARDELANRGIIGICGREMAGKRSVCVYAPGDHRKPARKPAQPATAANEYAAASMPAATVEAPESASACVLQSMFGRSNYRNGEDRVHRAVCEVILSHGGVDAITPELVAYEAGLTVQDLNRDFQHLRHMWDRRTAAV